MAGQRLQTAATALLRKNGKAAQAAAEAGYRGTEALARDCVKQLGLTPRELQRLPTAREYTFTYGGAFHLKQMLAYLGRDEENQSETLEGNVFRRHFPVGGRSLPVALKLEDKACTVTLPRPLKASECLEFHAALRRFLGLDQPLEKFYKQVRAHPVFAPLIKPLRGVRVPQVPTLWEALSWAVMGQQINLAFAYRLRNRLIRLGNGDRGEIPQGDVLRDGVSQKNGRAPLPFPPPEAVLGLPEGLLREHQFSRQKAAYLGIVARACLEGPLRDLSLADTPVEEAEARLLSVKGIGRWTMAYGLMRHLGHMDALPLGDAGLRSALREQFALAAPPDEARQEKLMEPFRPYRGLATYYLWRAKSARKPD